MSCLWKQTCISIIYMFNCTFLPWYVFLVLLDTMVPCNALYLNAKIELPKKTHAQVHKY